MAAPESTTLPFHPQSQISPTNEEAIKTADIAQLPFLQAARAWLESRKPYLHPRTFLDYGYYIKTLGKFFGETRLPEIDADQIRAYQKVRMLRAGASAINHECSILQQMLKRAGKWAEIAPDFAPLRLPRESPGRAITNQEEDAWFRMAASNPLWEVCYWASTLSINTTAGPGEILHMRLCDVDLDKRTMRVNSAGAKNAERIRVMPLNESALWAAKLFQLRAVSLGSTSPDHFLIPFLIHKGQYDPTRPTKGYFKAFKEILAAAGLKFRPYDFRHTAITRMLERGVPEETVSAMAGHISLQMLKRYSHIRLEAKWGAVETLLRKPPQSVVNMLQAEDTKTVN